MTRKCCFSLLAAILVVISLFGCAQTQTESTGNTEKEDTMKPVSVMFFNILNGWGSNKNYSDPAIREKWVVEIVKEQSPDLIGFQETSNRSIVWKDELHKDLCGNGGYDHRALDQETGFKLKEMTTGAGLIIFWKADRFDYVASGCHEYTQPSKQIRYFQWVKLYDKVYGKNVVMTNTHLSINSDSKAADDMGGIALRNSEARELYDFWQKNVAQDAVLFATGDYNGTIYETLHNTLQTDKRFLPSIQVAQEYDGKARIDFVYTSPATVGVLKAQTLSYSFEDRLEDKNLEATFYKASDHAPVMTWAYYK